MKRILLTLTLVLFIAPFTTAQDLPSYIPTDGLESYYTFKGNANDNSGNGNNGIVSGATLTVDKDGNTNSAYSFDGISNTIGFDSPFFNGQQVSSFTLFARFNVLNLEDSPNIWGKALFWGEVNFYLLSDANSVYLMWANSVNGNRYSGVQSSNNSISNNEWIDVAITFENQQLKVYKNGVLINSTMKYTQQGGGFLSNSQVEEYCNFAQDANSNKIGMRLTGGNPGNYFKGVIDDFGIWNRALSEQEIQNLYNSSTGDILLNGTVSAENHLIKNVTNPVDAQDVATKNYVDIKTYEISNSQNFSNNSQIGLTGVVYDFEGNKYNTVVMCDGKQWTTQYLNVSFFANGDPIPEVVGNDAWRDLTTPAWCYPFNDDSGIGKLYNGFALTDARGLAPEGWHIATEDDWNNLIECLGGADVAGGKIKLSGTEYWAAPNVGSGPSGKASNSSGMSLTPAASREGANGNFYFQNSVGFWNYSTIDGRRPFVELIGDQAKINQGLTDPYDGSYILIVKD